MPERKNIYFASDLHLGMHPYQESLEREKLFVSWMEEIRKDAKELWLLGDVFDYWFEYKWVVPRGFTRFLGTLASLADEGIMIHMLPGNHDIWTFDYLPAEIGLEIHRHSLNHQWNGHHFHLGHGDGLHPEDRSYRMMQGMFRNRILQWFYSRIHPNGSMAFAHRWSRKSRQKHGALGEFKGAGREHQVQFAQREHERHPEIEYFVFGHRHIPYDIRIAENCRVICLGDWIGNFTYGVFDGTDFQLKKFLPDQGEIILMH